jgi:ectoine hydroxylase-related dioxygenase (phytanoyl-CoA dioxygenase family)
MLTHGVSEFRRNEDAVDALVEEIREVGFAVVEGVLTEEQLAEMRRRIDEVYDQQVEEVGGLERLALINDLDVARGLLAYDDMFVEMAAMPQVIEVVQRFLGEYIVLSSQNGIINRPSDELFQVTWHRDLQYRHFTSSRPLAMSALFAIDEFSAETGGTHFLPGSHRSEKFPSPEYVERHQVVAKAPAGSVVIFDAMAYHRAGANTSGRVRRAVNHIYGVPNIQQQISLPSALGGRFEDDPRLRRLLGYEAPPAASTLDWRERKLALAGAGLQRAEAAQLR